MRGTEEQRGNGKKNGNIRRQTAGIWPLAFCSSDSCLSLSAFLYSEIQFHEHQRHRA